MSAYALKQEVASFSAPTITLGSAVSGFNAFTSVDDGIEQSYIVFTGDDWQICTGVYTHHATTPTLVITNRLRKSVSGAPEDDPATNITIDATSIVIIGGQGLNQNQQFKDGVPSTNHFIPDNIFWYNQADGAPGNAFSATAGRITILSINFRFPTKITEMGFNISTASSGDNIRGAIYHCNNDGSVGDLIQDTGDISTTATGLVFATLSTPLLLPAGDYYQANMADNTVVRGAGIRSDGGGVLGSRQGDSGTSRVVETRNQYDVTYGAFPSTLSSPDTNTTLESIEVYYK